MYIIIGYVGAAIFIIALVISFFKDAGFRKSVIFFATFIVATAYLSVEALKSYGKFEAVLVVGMCWWVANYISTKTSLLDESPESVVLSNNKPQVRAPIKVTNYAALLQVKKDFVIEIFNELLRLRFDRPAPLDFEYLRDLLSTVESTSVHDFMDRAISGDIALSCKLLWQNTGDSSAHELLRGAYVLLDEISFGNYEIGDYPKR